MARAAQVNIAPVVRTSRTQRPKLGCRECKNNVYGCRSCIASQQLWDRTDGRYKLNTKELSRRIKHRGKRSGPPVSKHDDYITDEEDDYEDDRFYDKDDTEGAKFRREPESPTNEPDPPSDPLRRRIG